MTMKPRWCYNRRAFECDRVAAGWPKEASVRDTSTVGRLKGLVGMLAHLKGFLRGNEVLKSPRGFSHVLKIEVSRC